MVIEVLYCVYRQTYYCRSTLFNSFCRRQSSLLNKPSHSFCFCSHYLLVQASLLTVIVITFPGEICLKPVANNHQALKCGKRNLWIHIKCNKSNKQPYTYISYWFCMSCAKEFLPLSDTSDEELMQSTIGKRIKFTHIDNVPKSVKENFIQKITSEINTILCSL